MNYQAMVTAISTMMAVGGLTYQAGRHSETITSLGVRVSQAETRSRDHDTLLFDIHGKICAIEKDIKHIVKKINGDS